MLCYIYYFEYKMILHIFIYFETTHKRVANFQEKTTYFMKTPHTSNKIIFLNTQEVEVEVIWLNYVYT